MSKIIGYNNSDENSVGSSLKKILESQKKANLPVGDKLLEQEREKFDYKTDGSKPEETLLREESDNYDTDSIAKTPYNTLLETKHHGSKDTHELTEKKLETKKALGVPHRNESAWDGDVPKLRELTNALEVESASETEEFKASSSDSLQEKNIGDQKDLPKHKITQNTPQQENYDPTQSPSTKYYDGDNASHSKKEGPEYFSFGDFVEKGLSNGWNARAAYNKKVQKLASNEKQDIAASMAELDKEFIALSEKGKYQEEDFVRMAQIKIAKSKLLGIYVGNH
jgi:hypothetical protein